MSIRHHGVSSFRKSSITPEDRNRITDALAWDLGWASEVAQNLRLRPGRFIAALHQQAGLGFSKRIYRQFNG